MVSVVKSLLSKEALLALVVGLVTNKLITTKKKSITSSIKAVPPQLVNLDSNEVFTSNELSTLTTVWGDSQPVGKFLKGRHGITHYKVDLEKKNSKKGMVILCHGLGQSLKMYQELTDTLKRNGFSVLRYDYFGHGYSKYQGDKNDKWIKYTTEIFVDQLEDLMDHVIKESQQEIVAFVGHSNGGVVGIAANYRWSRGTGSPRKILPKLILCNPAIYARKPFVAQIADRIPTVMTTLMKVIPPALSLVGENYIQSIENAFGKDENGEYLYPEAFKASIEENKRLYGVVDGVKEHPFLAQAVLGVSSYCIPAGLLPEHRQKLAVLASSDEGEILYLWGDKDITVPYKENIDEVRSIAKNGSIMKVETMKNISHECFLENTPVIVDLILPILNA